MFTKECPRCNRTLPVSEFNGRPNPDWGKRYNHKTPIWTDTRCRDCTKAVTKLRIKVMKARREGRLKAPDRCSHCQQIGRIHGHHEDYYKPFDIIWLCVSCHSNVHHGNITLNA